MCFTVVIDLTKASQAILFLWYFTVIKVIYFPLTSTGLGVYVCVNMLHTKDQNKHSTKVRTLCVVLTHLKLRLALGLEAFECIMSIKSSQRYKNVCECVAETG